MLWTLLLVAHGQSVTGGFGTGAFASANALTRLGWITTASVEVGQLTEEVPWLGVGAEAELGLAPRFCTACRVQRTARLGAGPVFRQGPGFLMVGARYSLLTSQTTGTAARTPRVRPFLMSKASLPIAGMAFRPFLWAEGLRNTEVGAGLEVGFRLHEDKLVVRESTKPRPEPPSPEPQAPESPDPESPEPDDDAPG